MTHRTLFRAFIPRFSYLNKTLNSPYFVAKRKPPHNRKALFKFNTRKKFYFSSRNPCLIRSLSSACFAPFQLSKFPVK